MDELTNVGVAAVIVILLLRELLPYLKAKSKGESEPRIGSQTVEYWEMKIAQIVAKETTQLVALKNREMDLLNDIRDDIIQIKERMDRRDGRQR